eukprot:6126045-Karenia_brevis.AAC.1
MRQRINETIERLERAARLKIPWDALGYIMSTGCYGASFHGACISLITKVQVNSATTAADK